MSLGAKELFHTNFLAFLLESDDPALCPIQLAVRDALTFPRREDAVTKCAVWREKNNLDLVVVELRLAPFERSTQAQPAGDDEDVGEQSDGRTGGWDWDPAVRWTQSGDSRIEEEDSASTSNPSRYVPTGRVLIVEAKLKSIPRLDQLTEYDEQLANRGLWLEYPEDAAVPEWSLRVGGGYSCVIERRLLSVSGIPMTTAETAIRPPGHWKGVTWKLLQVEMRTAVDSMAPSPMSQTLDNYTKVLHALVQLIGRVHQLCDDAYSAVSSIPPYGSVRKQTLAPQFKSLRINDLLGKTLFDHWLHSHLLKTTSVNLPLNWSLNGYVNYSNGVPGLGIEIINEKFLTQSGDHIGLSIGVQIQNSEFRLFIDIKSGWTGLEAWIATHPRLIEGWFSTPVFGNKPVGYRSKAIMPPTRTERSTNLKVFDKNRFLYSKRDIDNESFVAVGMELKRVLAIAVKLAPDL